jgi:hypothetical protein
MDEDTALTNISMQMRATVRRPRRRIFSELSEDAAIENLLLTNDEEERLAFRFFLEVLLSLLLDDDDEGPIISASPRMYLEPVLVCTIDPSTNRGNSPPTNNMAEVVMGVPLSKLLEFRMYPESVPFTFRDHPRRMGIVVISAGQLVGTYVVACAREKRLVSTVLQFSYHLSLLPVPHLQAISSHELVSGAVAKESMI